MCKDGTCGTPKRPTETVRQMQERATAEGRRRRSLHITAERIAEIRQAAESVGPLTPELDELFWLAAQGRRLWCWGCGGFHTK